MNNTYILSDNEKNKMYSLSFTLKDSCDHNIDVFLITAKYLSQELPENLKTFLKNFMNEYLTDDIAIIKNLPYDTKITTPEDNSHFIGENTILSRCQTIINEFIGEMVSYEAEAHGRFFQDMVPNKRLMKTQTSLGSKIELELHTEQAFSDLRPDFLCLSCLKGDENAKTYYLHVNDIINHLPSDNIDQLKQKLWDIGVDLSFIMNGCADNKRGPVSILEGKNLLFDQDLMVGHCDNSTQIIEKIVEIYYTYRKFYVLTPGDSLIINNNRLVHGRSSFEPNFDGNDRFIIRSFILNTLDKIKNKTGSHNRMISIQHS
tara:strand:+ start:955 stop:1905 length:951 start_codon:yes stop_codon:yes gene_type:complete